MKNCCNTTKKTKQCVRKSDNKVFSLPRRFTRRRCLKGIKGFTMRSSCAPFKDCKKGGGKTRKNTNSRKRAIVILHKNKNKITGTIKFSQKNRKSPVLVNYYIKGLSDGKHGFHVHQLGNLGNKCLKSKGHFNPNNKEHGKRMTHDRHAGDLGNIKSKNKVSKGRFYDKHITLFNHKNNIIGRSIVVHEKEDDLGLGKNRESKKTGNAGARIACGVIGVN